MDLCDRADQLKVLIRDPAGQFTSTFDTVPADAGITACKIPPRSPRVNAFAERFVGTVRRAVTDRMQGLARRAAGGGAPRRRSREGADSADSGRTLSGARVNETPQIHVPVLETRRMPSVRPLLP